MRDQQGITDNEGIHSVYESATDNDLLVFMSAVTKDMKSKKESRSNLHDYLRQLSTVTKDEPSPTKTTGKSARIVVDEDVDNLLGEMPDFEANNNLDQAFEEIENQDWE
jgi:hypothetical protein